MEDSQDIELLKSQLDPEKIPAHVAVIMDGNGRWAQERGEPRIFGHTSAVESVQETVEGAVELGIKNLTLYAFSTENWNRPQQEVNALMELLISTINKELDTLNKNEVRLMTIGDTSSLPPNARKELAEAKKNTEGNKKLNLILALSYSSRWEIVEASKQLARDSVNGKIDPENITDDIFSSYLNTNGIPDPELMIRTSGESRISNFLLWQLAYAELYFTQKRWPDFRKPDLIEALLDYQRRERRFGMTSEQVSKLGNG